MLTSKIVNPTPFKVEFNWDKGIVLEIPPDGELDLTMQQMDDFRPGKPGTEEVKHQMDYYGIFLLDGDRSWEEQAIKALESSFKVKKAQVDQFVTNMRNSRISAGAPVNEDAMEELIVMSGQGKVRDECETLQKRINHLRKILDKTGTKGKVKETLDPKRTCFILNPPKQFMSETQLELFLMDQTPEFRKKHEEFQKSLGV